MKLPIPATVGREACYKPVTDLMHDTIVTSKLLAERWGYSVDHLSNLRRARQGLPFIRLPLGPKQWKGGIRYRLSDIVSAEIGGTFGPTTIERVCIAIAACAAITPEQRVAVQAHVRQALAEQ